MDRQERRRHRAGQQPLQLRLIPACEINFASVPANFGVDLAGAARIRALTRPYVDQFNVGVTREVMRGVSVSGEWFHNDAQELVGAQQRAASGHATPMAR